MRGLVIVIETLQTGLLIRVTVAGPGLLTAAVDFLASLAAILPPLLGLRE